MRATMLVPPPPPPPSAPPPPPPAPLQCSDGGGRGALLADIQKGTRLKKVTQVNDRSAPSLQKPKENSVDGCGRGLAAGGSGATQGPTLSSLFAAGFPVLRPVGQRDKRFGASVSRSGSVASLKQPLWNLPSQGEGFRGSTPDLSPSHKPLERSSSLSKPRPLSSYTAPSSPSQPLPPNLRSPSSPPPPPPPLFYQDRYANRPPPLPTGPPPPPPPQMSKPTWLPVHPLPIPMPTTAPPALPPSLPPSALPDRCPGFYYPPPPSPSLFDAKFCNFRESLLAPLPPSPPPLPASFTPSLPSSLPPPPPPPKVPPVPSPAYRPAVPPLPPSYPCCTVPCRRAPTLPRSAGAGRLAPPPAPPARSPTTELSSRSLPPPPPPLPPAPPNSMRNGYLHSLDDFESKFQFHPVEDFPPPEEFRPFSRTYPSKENRVTSHPPGVRTHLR